jgi:hypothetical protein
MTQVAAMDDDFELSVQDFFAAEPVPAPEKRAADTRRIIAMAESGAADEEIAAFFGYSQAAWAAMMERDKELHAAIERAPLAGKAALRRRQYQLAVAGDSKMLKHLGEHALGQVARTELTGAHGGAIKVESSLSATDQAIIDRYIQSRNTGEPK